MIHAAAVDATSSLCGIDLLDLYEFGRSFQFEHFPHHQRCPVCNEAAGWPSE
jgi:hypothetical protein